MSPSAAPSATCAEAAFTEPFFFASNYSFNFVANASVIGEATMWFTKYDTAAILPASEVAHLTDEARAKLVPDLWVVDRSTCTWMQARDTCAAPYWTVDAAAQTYTVAVCDFAPGGAPSELRLFFHVAPTAVAHWFDDASAASLTVYRTWWPLSVQLVLNATSSTDLDFGLLSAAELADTLLAPTANSGRAIAGGRWGPAWPAAHSSRAQIAAWTFNIALFVCAVAALLDMLLVSAEVKWNSDTSYTFFLSLVHSLLTADGIKVAVLTSVAALLVPIGSAPKSKAAKRFRRVLHGVANFLQAIL